MDENQLLEIKRILAKYFTNQPNKTFYKLLKENKDI